MSREAHVQFCESLGVRFPGATHLVVGFQYRDDAERFGRELRDRLAKFGLELNVDKTRLIEFGRWAEQNRKQRGEGKPETFNFLGFTHYCGQHRKGYFALWRKTTRKRMVAKLEQINQQLRLRRHEPISQVGKWLQQAVTGYDNYHAVPGNQKSLGLFRVRLSRLWRHALRQRGDRSKMNWDRFNRICARYLPPARTLHPYHSRALPRITRTRRRVRTRLRSQRPIPQA